jgi:Nickel responsive protein SCO4226-like
VLAMAVYMVDRDLKGITLEQLGAAQRRAIETGKQFTAEGKNVKYLRSVFVPGESHCMCLFEAPSPQLVKEVNEVAQIPFTRIVEAMDLTP